MFFRQKAANLEREKKRCITLQNNQSSETAFQVTMTGGFPSGYN